MDIKINSTLCKNININTVYLFGSQAKKAFQHRSDVDIALLFSKNLNCFDAFKKTSDFEYSLRKLNSFKFDIVILNSASSLLKYEVLASNKVLYCADNGFRIDFEVQAIKEYIDEQSYRNIYNFALYERIQKGA